MKLVINASNLVSLGGMQVAYSFILECRKFSGNDYHVFLCPKLSAQIDKSEFGEEFKFYDVEIIPFFAGRGRKELKRLIKLEKEISPDVVFSVFGPIYWTPRAKHLMGFAMPHYVYADSPYFQLINLKDKIYWKLNALVKMSFFARNAFYYHVETEDVRLRLAKYLSITPERIFTVSNTYNAVYDQYDGKLNQRLLPLNDREFRLVCITSYYDHKNLEILNKVIPELLKRGYQHIRFVLTINQDIFNRIFSPEAKGLIINTGPVPIASCPGLYSEVNAAFLPTLLECFSANYPEAMKMEKPVLTSDLSFATDVCANAALYFNPVNARDIADKIIELVEHEALQKQLVENGKVRLKDFCTASQRAEKYMEICKKIAENNRPQPTNIP